MSWQSIIADIQKRGLSQAQIATACGCGQATISDLAKGSSKEPRHALGESLLKIKNASDEEIGALRAPTETKVA
ncbi:helix-turn-helix domain-containing protein [Variovorax paradoxus]|nr:helix-turn-helix transcriptional regulator [Variovorax paradoxus]MBT2299234.1 helix-turn-helix domain-containing protein [Variovorax paradoxus]